MSKSKLTPYQRKLKEQRKTERERKKLACDGAEMAIHTLFIMLPYTMMHFYGWRNKRLCRLIKQMNIIMRGISSEGLELDRLASELEHDAYIRFNFNDNLIKDLKGDKL